MSALGLYVQLEAKPGKEKAVADFLASALPLVEAEPETKAWFAVRLGPSTFAIFDVFDDEHGRDAHLAGRVAEALMAHAPDPLAKAPSIQKLEVIADTLGR